MKKCEWCNKEVQYVAKCNNLGVSYNICRMCADILMKKMCRVCGGPLGKHSIKGVCLPCTQLGYTEANKHAEEASKGVDSITTKMFASDSNFTEDDFNSWMTFGTGYYSPEKRRQTRINWLKKRLKDNPDWTPETIEQYFMFIEKLMDRNFDKIASNQFRLVIITSGRYTSFIDYEGPVAIVTA